MDNLPPKPKTNAELNKALCERGAKLPVREVMAVDAKSIRQLSVEEVSAWRGHAVSESAKKGVEKLYEAKVMHADRINQNARIYPAAVLSGNIARLKPMLDGGQLVGCSGHPNEEEYSGDPGQICAKWVGLRMENDGAVTGTFSVVPTDPAGKNLQVVLDAKLSALGFSSYGFGSAHQPTEEERKAYGMRPEDKEIDYNSDGDYVGPIVMDSNYELVQMDCVRGPSVPDAAVTKYPEKFVEIAGGRFTLAEACSTGLHWREFGRCGHLVSECKCESETKHAVYTEKVCPKCAGTVSEGMTKDQFVSLLRETKPTRVRVTESREPLAKAYTQYVQKGNSFSPAGPIKLAPELSKDAFNIIPTWDGIRFERRLVKCDQAYRFEGSPCDVVLREIDEFWKKKEQYKKFGIMHRRGVVVHGPPGTGKSIGISQAVEMVTAAGDVAFYGEDIGALKEALDAFREVEPDRKVLVVMEDAERYIGYQEGKTINLLDGADSVDGVLYMASTNYLNKFPERLIRSRRFDRKVFIGPPNLAGRKAYFQNKLGATVSAEEVDRIAKETDGLSYGDLATLITDAFILDEQVDAVISRLKGTQSHIARLPEGKQPQRSEPVQERRTNPTTENDMDPIKSLKDLQTSAPAVHAEHVAALAAETSKRVAAEKVLADAINPLLKSVKALEGIELPQREVLPAEISERQTKLEAKIITLETDKAALATEKSTLTAKVAELQAKLDAKDRASKVFAAAKPLLTDNAYADLLKEAIREKCVSDPSFDDTKVAAFIDDRCAYFDRVSGGKSKGKKQEGKAAPEKKPAAGAIITDDELDALEAASESGSEEPSSEKSESSALTEAFGKTKTK